MGRTSLSGWPMLRRLRAEGIATRTFDYSVGLQDYNRITERLAARISEIAEADEYFLIGHSLGGVLLRSALNALPPHVKRPRHLFLLGSPQRPSRMARRLRGNVVYRIATRDCGHLLGSAPRMSAIGAVDVPTTSIAGDRGVALASQVFRDEANDGVVSISEVSAGWIADQRRVPVVHTLLPASGRVAGIILERIFAAK
jgi:pimeloyl-ACP methyl ester carboxylesterase